MDAKELRIDCPCCKAALVVDSLTGRILEAVPHKDAPPSLEEFMKADKNRHRDIEDKFAEAKQKEDTKLEFLNRKFDWARKNKDRLPEAPKPDIMWD